MELLSSFVRARLSHADIFVSHVRAAGCSPPQCQFTIEDVFRNATIIHTADMTQPSQSALSKQSVHTGKTSTRQESALVTLSSQDMPRMRRMLLRWNVLHLLSCLAYVVHVSLPCSNVLITQATQEVSCTPMICALPHRSNPLRRWKRLLVMHSQA